MDACIHSSCIDYTHIQAEDVCVFNMCALTNSTKNFTQVFTDNLRACIIKICKLLSVHFLPHIHVHTRYPFEQQP